MIALEVCVNGKKICVAGTEDLGVLSANVTACGILGKKTVRVRPDETSGEIFYSVGGLTSRPDPEKDVHIKWKSITPLNVGDVIQIRILETETVDRAISRKRANRKHSVPRYKSK